MCLTKISKILWLKMLHVSDNQFSTCNWPKIFFFFLSPPLLFFCLFFRKGCPMSSNWDHCWLIVLKYPTSTTFLRKTSKEEFNILNSAPTNIGTFCDKTPYNILWFPPKAFIFLQRLPSESNFFSSQVLPPESSLVLVHSSLRIWWLLPKSFCLCSLAGYRLNIAVTSGSGPKWSLLFFISSFTEHIVLLMKMGY